MDMTKLRSGRGRVLPRRTRRLIALTLASSLLAVTPSTQAAETDPASSAGRASDLDLYAAVRAEGLERSQAMPMLAELADGIGPRLTGSPNMRKAYDWALATLTRLGLENARLEQFGLFPSWAQKKSWVRMSAPDSMMFVAQAAPWSVSTRGPIEGDTVAVELANEQDLEKWRGRLAGKIVLLGPLRPVLETVKPFTRRYSDEEVRSGAMLAPVRGIATNRQARAQRMIDANRFKVRVREFLDGEGIRALIIPSRDGADGGGTGNIAVDNGAFGYQSWDPAHRPSFPIAVVAIENFGRAWRLSTAGTPVRLELDIDVAEGAMEPAYNVIADIPGTDPRLKPQIVLAGAHLDSWASGTGAVDNGTGIVAVLEAIRILKAVNFRPRRTIRVALFGGEEQGLLGAQGYVETHLGDYPHSSAPDQMLLPSTGLRARTGPLKKLPGYDRLSVAYHMDGGSGALRGVFTGGGNPGLAARYRQWIAPLADLGMLSVFDEGYFPADQSTFTNIGLPGIIFLQDPLDYFSRAHHSNIDTLERVSPRDLAQSATVLAIFIANSAAADDRMPRCADTCPGGQ